MANRILGLVLFVVGAFLAFIAFVAQNTSVTVVGVIVIVIGLAVMFKGEKREGGAYHKRD